MKKIENQISSLEASDLINSFKYCFFGRTYQIVNSKMSVKKKKVELENLLRELYNDPIIKNFDKTVLFYPVEEIIIGKIKEIDYILEVKKFKLPFKIPLFKSYNIRGI